MATQIHWPNGEPKIRWQKNPRGGGTSGLGDKWPKPPRDWILVAIIHNGKGKAIGTLHINKTRIRMDCDNPNGHTHPQFRSYFLSLNKLHQVGVTIDYIDQTPDNLVQSLKLLKGKQVYALRTPYLENPNNSGTPLPGIVFYGKPLNTILQNIGLQALPPPPPLLSLPPPPPPIKTVLPPTEAEFQRTVSNGMTKDLQELGEKGEKYFFNILDLAKDKKKIGDFEGPITDVTKDKKGWDFDCCKNNVEVHVEVKTFKDNGQVFITHNEWEKAYGDSISDTKNYWLVGLLWGDDGKPSKAHAIRSDVLIARMPGVICAYGDWRWIQVSANWRHVFKDAEAISLPKN